MMDAGGGHQVPQVVRLEVESILEGLRGGIAGAVLDQDRSMDVAVVALRPGDDADHLVHPPIQVLILRDGGERGGRFEPLVEVAVIPGRPPVSALGETRRDREIVIELARFRAAHDLPQVGDHDAPARLESIPPEALGPLDVAKADAAHHHVRAGRCVGQSTPSPARLARVMGIVAAPVQTGGCPEGGHAGGAGRDCCGPEEEFSAIQDLFSHRTAR